MKKSRAISFLNCKNLKINPINSHIDFYNEYPLSQNPLNNNKYSCDYLKYNFFGENSNLIVEVNNDKTIEKSTVLIPKSLDLKFLKLLKKHYGEPYEIYKIGEALSSKSIEKPEYSVNIMTKGITHTTIDKLPNRLIWKERTYLFEVTINYQKGFSKLVFSKR